ncbi:hypothetical protein G7046_g9314 [Stylonectria norvegica]|nr:hypothetical protein G7046_g9314 [Stylonectria norvegica]
MQMQQIQMQSRIGSGLVAASSGAQGALAGGVAGVGPQQDRGAGSALSGTSTGDRQGVDKGEPSDVQGSRAFRVGRVCRVALVGDSVAIDRRGEVAASLGHKAEGGLVVAAYSAGRSDPTDGDAGRRRSQIAQPAEPYQGVSKSRRNLSQRLSRTRKTPAEPLRALPVSPDAESTHAEWPALGVLGSPPPLGRESQTTPRCADLVRRLAAAPVHLKQAAVDEASPALRCQSFSMGTGGCAVSAAIAAVSSCFWLMELVADAIAVVFGIHSMMSESV